METTIKKWGNSLGLRIPKSFANQVGVEDGATVYIVLDGDKMVITPKAKDNLTIEELLKGVTTENKHDVVETGTPQGKEVW